MAKETTVLLPSFLRRVMRAYALKAEIRALGCELQRAGRSRNWRLIGTAEQINNVCLMIEQTGEDSWLWVAKKLRLETEKLSHELLLSIAKKNDGITVNELMAKTDCTVIDARRVIDEIEWADE